MKPRTRIAVVLVALTLAGVTAHAVERGTTDEGVAFVSGGIGQSELKTLHGERGLYTLWVATLAKGSGAYLSDARLRVVREPDRRVVIEHIMAGPWFFAALPPGRYEIVATNVGRAGEETQTLSVTVRKGVLRQAVLRFASDADVGPEREHPFGGNPFAASAVAPASASAPSAPR